ncbi:MAG: zinc-ribbon domain-containing protein [Candidatus Thorarchaeota archaeon]
MIEISYCHSCGNTIEPGDKVCTICGTVVISEDSPIEKKSASFQLSPQMNVTSSTSFPQQQPISAHPIYYTQPPPQPLYSQPYYNQPVIYAQPLQMRNFWMWLLLGVLTAGIGYFIYAIFNYLDLKKLADLPRPPGIPDPRMNDSQLATMLIISFIAGFPILPLIFYYQKYDRLYTYIRSHPQPQPTIPSTGGAFILLSLLGAIIINLVIWIPYGFIISMVSYLYLDIAIIIWAVLTTLIYGGYLFLLIRMEYRWQKAYNERVKIFDPNAEMKLL